MRLILTAAIWLACCLPLAAQDIVTGLAAHYTFNADGTDETANNRDLTTIGSPTFVAGHVGNAARLASANLQRFEATGLTFLEALDTYTISFWGRLKANTGDGDSTHRCRAIQLTPSNIQLSGRMELGASRMSASTLSGQAIIANWVRGSLGAAFAELVGTAGANPSYVAETDDVWQFVCIVVNGGAATLYNKPDGGALTSQALTGDWTLADDTDKLRVGISGRFEVDQLRIYTRALVLADVEALAAE